MKRIFSVFLSVMALAAAGFHASAIVFLPAYFVFNLTINIKKKERIKYAQ